jgi:hypothetical protein
VDEQRRHHDERVELEEFGLPVLQGGLRELGDEVGDAEGLAVRVLFGDVDVPLGEPLGDPAGEEQDGESDAQPKFRQILRRPDDFISFRMLRAIEKSRNPAIPTRTAVSPTASMTVLMLPPSLASGASLTRSSPA